MNVLLDTCVWGGARKALEEAGYQVEWIGDREADPGDEAIIEHAFERGMVLVTLDKDFGELAVVMRKPHHGIVRLVGIRAREQGPVCAAILKKYSTELSTGAILTVETSRVRIRSGEGPTNES